MVWTDRKENILSEEEHAAIVMALQRLEANIAWGEKEIHADHDGMLVIELPQAGIGQEELEVYSRDILNITGRRVEDVEYTFRFPQQRKTAIVNRKSQAFAEPGKHLRAMLDILPGSCVEYDTINARARLLPPKKMTWWASDARELWKIPYQQDIYPAAVTAVSQLTVKFGQQMINHVDLFGGDGEFDGWLHLKANKTGTNLRTHIVDGDASSLAIATYNHANENVLIHPVINIPEKADEIWQRTGMPHIVTSIGGLTHLVTTREQSLRVIQSVYTALQPGGFFVLTGLMDANVNAHDLKDVGFTVKQKSISKNIYTDNKPWHLYVAEKNELV